MERIHNYGEYKRLFRSRQLWAALSILAKASRNSRVNYMLVGGSAVYLHTQNPPEDFPDIDIVLDTNRAGARRFSREARRLGFRLVFGDETQTDVFIKMAYKKFEFDFFTDQSDRKNLGVPVFVGVVPVRSIEGLIAEKMIRGSYPDCLMAIDLLGKKYHAATLRDLARQYRFTGRLAVLSKIAKAFHRGVVGRKTVKHWAEKISGTNRLDHF